MDFKRMAIWTLTVVAAVIAGIFADQIIRRRVGTLIKVTSLEFLLRGGFAYVNTPQQNMVEVAYLKDTNVEGCSVPQPGTDLIVMKGTITVPSPAPANKTFDVGGAVITVAHTLSTGGPIGTKPAHPPSPNKPADVNQDIDWEDPAWLPYVSPDYPTSSLNPNWRTMVDGRLVLTGGKLTGAPPSKLAIRDKMWEWRTTSGTAMTYQQALTDTMRYTSLILDDVVTLTLTGARSGVTKIVVKPSTAGDRVVLLLNGRHDMSDPPPGVGDPVKHFCAFYQLMQQVPPLSDQYLPYLLGSAAEAAGGGRGSPGYFCPGDGF